MSVARVILLVLVLSVIGAPMAWTAEENVEVDPEVPNTLVKITGNKIITYSFFFGILTAFCLMLIYRGIRAH